jgi:hypothetical protein
MKMAKPKKLVCGIGANDADYIVQPVVNGKKVWCKFYQTWVSMLKRCYSQKTLEAHPTYKGCTVVQEWHSFMAFRAWMISQPWVGMQLDKDLLYPGNKVYSPETCIFVSSAVNKFTTDSASARGEFPIGVCWNKKDRKFQAHCGNPFTGKQEYLGRFDCPLDAHESWRKKKHDLAVSLAAKQDDDRLAKALSFRYIKGGCYNL